MSSELANARLQTAGGIRYKLMPGYPTIKSSDEGTQATERYLIDAANVPAFHAESFPPPILLGTFFVLPPRRRMPGTGYLVTKSIDFAPFEGERPADPLSTDTGAPARTYDDYMIATIQYETMKDSDNSERDESRPETFLEHSMTAGGEFLSIPPAKTQTKDEDVDGKRKAAAGDQQKDNRDQVMPIIKTIPTIEHTMKWTYALNPDWATIYSYLGTVNSNQITLFNDAKPETVMFTGVSGRQQYVWDGASARVQPWTLDFKFSQRYIVDKDENGADRTIGWNHVYSPDRKGWMRLILNPDTGENLYQEKDFRNLFKAGP